MSRLDFSYADLDIPAVRVRTARASISGVQDKVQLKKVRGGFEIVESGGDYILKPVPRGTPAGLPQDIPVNEALTMDIAGREFGIKVAEHCLVELKDGEPAYLTKRFDRENGIAVRQEDFCQLSNRSGETHGDNYKYDASYEEVASLIEKFCPASAIEKPKVFFVILFNYIFANGDAHLKNFSLLEGPQGDYILAPAYDLLNTSVHFQDEPASVALEFFADGHYTAEYERLGFYSSADFIELGLHFGVTEPEVRRMIGKFFSKREAAVRRIEASRLSATAKERYLDKLSDRLRAIGQ